MFKMLKKIVRIGPLLVVALGLVLPTLSAQEPQKTEKTKKKTGKAKRKGGGEQKQTDLKKGG